MDKQLDSDFEDSKLEILRPLLDKYSWKKHGLPYPFGLNSTTAVLILNM